MHNVVLDELERHFSGNATRAFYQHLETCDECRTEVAEMDSISVVLREMRADVAAAPQPSLGFATRVIANIAEKQQKEAWGLFSPGAVFFRRIAFASLLAMAFFGTFLVSRELDFEGTDSTDAVAVMAQHDATSTHADSADRDLLLVKLVNYSE